MYTSSPLSNFAIIFAIVTFSPNVGISCVLSIASSKVIISSSVFSCIGWTSACPSTFWTFSNVSNFMVCSLLSSSSTLETLGVSSIVWMSSSVI